MYAVAPFGERRADLRAAHNTLSVIISQAAKKLTNEECQDIFETLSDYLISTREAETLPLDREALKRLQRST